MYMDVYMTTTVTFRCTNELEEFLEQEAERRMTTKSSVAQMLLAEKFREIQEERAGGDVQTGSDEGVEAEPLDEVTRFEFSSKDAADAVRTEFSAHLSDEDDKRMSDVWFREGTPGEVVAEIRRRQS